MVFFYLVATGWIFDVIRSAYVCNNSIDQSIRNGFVCYCNIVSRDHLRPMGLNVLLANITTTKIVIIVILIVRGYQSHLLI